jgi:hypothetical protein
MSNELENSIFELLENQKRDHEKIIAQELAPYIHNKRMSDADKLLISLDGYTRHYNNLSQVLASRHLVAICVKRYEYTMLPFEAVEAWIQNELPSLKLRIDILTKKIQELENS